MSFTFRISHVNCNVINILSHVERLHEDQKKVNYRLGATRTAGRFMM